MVDPAAVREIFEYSQGYPLGVQLACLEIKESGGFNETTLEEACIRVFRYFDSAIFGQWEEEVQQFLLCVADFESFDMELAMVVSENNRVPAMLEYIARVGDFIYQTQENRYQFRPFMTRYLIWRRSVSMPEDAIREIRRRAALYFQLHGQVERALELCRLAKDEGKMLDLLVENAKKHPGTAHFYETRRYYFSLPEERIMEQPVLMAGMSMLYSLMLQPKKSEEWYERLAAYEKKGLVSREKRQEARSRLAYLDIALPHRGIKNLTSIFKSAAVLCVGGGMTLPEFSVTSNLPSLMNGGKDFCEWSKRDRELARVLKIPVETVLGKYGMGLVNIALAESAFEKSSMEDYEIMSLVSSGTIKAETEGRIEICFAGTGVLVKLHMSHNQPKLALRLLEAMRRRAEQEEAPQILPNIEAMEAWIALQQGNMQAAQGWLAKAPDENTDFYILDRYRYMIKLRCYLAEEEYDAAWNLSEKLNFYFETYQRNYMWMENMILRAILSYRLGRPQWKQLLDQALQKAEEYHFIWLAAQEGIALKPLLEEHGVPDSEYGRALLKATRTMAFQYPRYLTKAPALAEPLTEMERRILRLHCEGLTTKEILKILCITERTLKFHNTNIYRKLGAKNRQEAVYIARQTGLGD